MTAEFACFDYKNVLRLNHLNQDLACASYQVHDINHTAFFLLDWKP